MAGESLILRRTAVWLVAVAALGVAPPAVGIDALVDVGSCRGVDWVVEDPVGLYLIAGTGFSEPPCAPVGHELIADNCCAPNFPWQARVPDLDVGESLYRALPPRELQGGHPGMRRVFIATESVGLLGYFEPATGGVTLLAQSPAGFGCGTAIGYRPDLDAVYFGYVNCGAPATTKIHKHQINGGTTLNYTEVPDLWVGGHYVNVGGLLHNIATNRIMGLICFGRQELNDTVHTLLACYPSSSGDANWSTAHYLGGYYYSEVDRTGDLARAYRINISAPTQRTELTNGTTVQSAAFLEDTDRAQLYVFAFKQNGDLTVACSIDGVTFPGVETVNAPGVAGPPGSVASIWRATSPFSVVWGVGRTAANIPSHGIVARTFLSCR